MLVHSLEMVNFRNYDYQKVEFQNGANILYGDNAQGKTNLLEALFVGGTTKSHKGSKDRELIQIGKDEAHIRIMLEKNSMLHKIDMHLKKNKSKGIAIDGVPIRKSSELIGLMNIVFFSPEDLGIIKHGPSERRRFIDMELCQLDKVYLYHLSNYNKVLNQRNNLLKQISKNHSLKDTISVWDEQLIRFGSQVIKRREQFLKELEPVLCKIHGSLSGEKENLSVVYEKNVSEEEFGKKVTESFERDLFSGTTNYGPHRDDVSFLIQDCDIRKYGSQGQQRTAALSLKLAEIDLIIRATKEKPILLLDDVLSELDRKRQNYLINQIKDIQTIITCTGLEEFINGNMQINKIYKVTDGTVERKDEEEHHE